MDLRETWHFNVKKKVFRKEDFKNTNDEKNIFNSNIIYLL